MSAVRGIGWWTPGSAGCLLRSIKEESSGQKVFTSEFRNFGRLDRDARASAYAVALALRDAAIHYPLAPARVAGIAGGSPEGCLGADLLYFRDYVDCGRTLGRGNYFIYTLPTSPLAECSIHFGLEGPVLYMAGGGSDFEAPLLAAHEAMGDGQADLMLAGVFSEQGAMFMVLAAGEGDGALGHEDVIEALEGDAAGRNISDSLKIIDNLIRERGIKAAV